jgi:hypothetical protein
MLVIKQKNIYWLTLHFKYNRKFITLIQNIKPSSYRKFNKNLSCWEIHYTKLALIVKDSIKFFKEIKCDDVNEVHKKVIDAILKHHQIKSKAIKSIKSVNAYETLFVTKSAPKEVIRAAYKALVMLYHPDHGGKADKFRMIQEAYDELKD